MQTPDPDVRLMLAFRAGDDSALSDLYRRWAGPLVRFLERMVRERSTAEELMQETFIRVHGARERYAPEARFSTWLFRIARNLALNELDRARNRMPHAPTDAPSRPDADASARPNLVLVAGGSGVDDLVDARRDQARLERELAALPERQRTALWLAAVEGHSYDEIAQILDTTTSSVKSLVHRARARLAERMADPTTTTDRSPARDETDGGSGGDRQKRERPASERATSRPAGREELRS